MGTTRSTVFSRHPKGEEILAKLINKQMTQTEAARILGCSVPNISSYLARRNLRPSLAQRKPTRGPSSSELAISQLDALDQMTLTIDGKTPLELLGAVGWRALQHGLTLLSQGELDADQYVKVSNQLLRMYEFQFRNRIPDIPKESVKIDKETENRLIQRLGEFCEQCQFRRAFDERKIKEQNKYRMESEQSASMG